MSGPLLTNSDIDDLLAASPAWVRDGDALSRSVVFSDFHEAFGFISRLGLVSERMFHHPEWRNVYNKVEVRITDHEAGGISSKDREWIERVDRLTS